jgi:hypothetical protein
MGIRKHHDYLLWECLVQDHPTGYPSRNPKFKWNFLVISQLSSPRMYDLPEADLIVLVKTQQDSAAFTILAERHAGIYLSVIIRYADAYPFAINRRDLEDDRIFNIHRFILDYDPTRGTKLSTYIGDRTDWMCKELLKRDRNNPISAGTYGPSGAVALTIGGDTYATPTGSEISLIDESPGARVVDIADRDIQIAEILEVAKRVVPDKRFTSILHLRHFNDTGPTSLSWRQIGTRVELSHEGARKLYNANLAVVKKHLMKPCIV